MPIQHFRESKGFWYHLNLIHVSSPSHLNGKLSARSNRLTTTAGRTTMCSLTHMLTRFESFKIFGADTTLPSFGHGTRARARAGANMDDVLGEPGNMMLLLRCQVP